MTILVRKRHCNLDEGLQELVVRVLWDRFEVGEVAAVVSKVVAEVLRLSLIAVLEKLRETVSRNPRMCGQMAMAALRHLNQCLPRFEC